MNFFALSTFALIVAGLAQGATYYVSTSGSDSNNGSAGSPFRHVSRGASAAHAGDTVVVMDGTYDNEGQTADSGGGGSVVTMYNTGQPGAPITIMAQHRGGAILDAASGSRSSLGCYGAWSYFDLSYTAYVTIQGFVIQNGCVNAFHANANAHDITIKWNEIRNIGNWDNPASSLSPTGIYINQNEYNFTFDGNIWHDIGGGSNVNQQHAIYTSATNVAIVNNLFYNQVHGWDIQTSGGSNVTIANNTFAFPNPSRQGHIVVWDGDHGGSLSNIVIENNVFYHPLDYAVVSLLSGPINGCTLQFNITTSGSMWDNGSSCSMSSNMTGTDPMLVNAGGLDFHLRSGSPALGTGMTLGFLSIDFDNLLRSGSFNRGAFGTGSGTPGAPPSGGSGNGSGNGSGGPVTPVTPVTPPAPTGTVTIQSNASPMVNAGGSVDVPVAAVISGSATATFTALGLPIGVSASFNPPSCTASCTTTMTIAANDLAAGMSTVFEIASFNGGVKNASAVMGLTINLLF